MPALIGKSFGQIADERGLHPLDAFLDVLVENGERNVRWTTIVANHRPKHLNALAIDPSVHMGFSDAGAHLRNMAFYNFAVKLLRRVRDAELAGKPFMTVEHAVYRLTAEVAEWFGLPAGTLREGDRADFVVIDPAGLDDSVDSYHEEKVPFYGDLSRMVNRNDEAIVATGVNGVVVFREGEFRDGYGETVKSGRFLKAGAARAGIRLGLKWPELSRSAGRKRSPASSTRASPRSWKSAMPAASAKVVAQRAQVSDGALFRHFPTMGDLMAATAHEAGRRQLEVAAKRIVDIPSDRPAIEEVLAIIRDLTGNSTNTVIYELMVAARTDEKLRDTLREVMTTYVAKIYEAARAVPSAEEIEAFGEENFTALVAVLINTFDGAAMFRHVLSHPDIEKRRIPVLLSLLDGVRR